MDLLNLAEGQIQLGVMSGSSTQNGVVVTWTTVSQTEYDIEIDNE